MIYYLSEIKLQSNEPSWTASGEHIWGTFFGLFGLPNNLRWVVSTKPLESLADAECLSCEALTPTARPDTFTPPTRPGVYVFRRFEVMPANVDRFVELSQEAWETFEGDDDFTAEPLGLFRPTQTAGIDPDQHTDTEMMCLITWYDSFAAWERSRRPDPAASENFRARSELTLTTQATATRLIHA